MYRYTMECHSAIKRNETESVVSDVDKPRACHTEWSESQREKQILYINTYIWNLEKRIDAPPRRVGIERKRICGHGGGDGGG